MDVQVYYGIGAIVIVAAIVYYTTKAEAGNNKDNNKLMSESEVRIKINDYLIKTFGKKIDWEDRLSYHAGTQPYEPARVNSTVPSQVMTFYGVIAAVYKDSGARVPETIRIIWDMDNDRMSRVDGMPNVINDFRDPKLNPFANFNPLIFLSQYAGERDREDKFAVNVFNKDRDFADPNAGAGA